MATVCHDGRPRAAAGIGREACLAKIDVNGIGIAYEIIGAGARRAVITPGGRFSKEAPGIRELAERIQSLDRAGRLLTGGPELLRLLGDIRTELFHYEVRSTYDTPDVAENRRIVEDAQRSDALFPDDPEEDEPWRRRPAD